MDIRLIKTEEDYRAILAEIESLMSAAPGAPEGSSLGPLTSSMVIFW